MPCVLNSRPVKHAHTKSQATISYCHTKLSQQTRFAAGKKQERMYVVNSIKSGLCGNYWQISSEEFCSFDHLTYYIHSQNTVARATYWNTVGDLYSNFWNVPGLFLFCCYWMVVYKRLLYWVTWHLNFC